MKRLNWSVAAFVVALALTACDSSADKKLIGSWQCTGATVLGSSLGCSGSWAFDKNHTYSGVITIGGKSAAIGGKAAALMQLLASGGGQGTWKLDASKNPIEIDFSNTSKPSQVVRGIIEFETSGTSRIGLPMLANIPPPVNFSSAFVTITLTKT